MNNEKILNDVKTIVINWTGVAPERVTMETVLLDLAEDSLNVLEIILDVEEHFLIEIPDEDSEKIKTVGDLAQFVVLRK